MTAVEWLCNQIYTINKEIEAGNPALKNKIEQAKEMEKQQIIDAVNNGWRQFDGKNYYEKTYKNTEK